MFSTDWQTSPREHEILVERDCKIPVSDGIELDCDVFRPESQGAFPAILVVHPYTKTGQTDEKMPVAFTGQWAALETGDYNFYVRRGYALVNVNMRGAYASGGFFGNLDPDPQSIRDIYDAIEWLAVQPWCDGNVGMTGVSYLAVVQKRVAALQPPHLKALFAPYGWTDGYRDLYYRGGILAHDFLAHWIKTYGAECRVRNALRESWGEEAFQRAVTAALADPEITQYETYAEALQNPDVGVNPLFCEILLNPLYGAYFEERAVDFQAASKIPLYAGGDWKGYAFHLAGDIRAFESWTGPKKLTIGPGIYLERPLHQYAYESLRWFDHWLKGVDTGLMDEPPVKLFIDGSGGEWKHATDWPVPGTRWTNFYLHDDGLLSEHEFWSTDSSSSFDDGPDDHGALTFRTPPMVEATEICGPIVLNLFGSTTADEVLWFTKLLRFDAQGREETLTRGWLRGSQRELDNERSRPWKPVHRHTRRLPLEPGEIYEFNIEVRPYGMLLQPGERVGLRIKCADDEKPASFIERIGQGQISSPRPARVTVHHSAAHPSHLVLPITRGNVIGTFLSGGVAPEPVRTTPASRASDASGQTAARHGGESRSDRSPPPRSSRPARTGWRARSSPSRAP